MTLQNQSQSLFPPRSPSRWLAASLFLLILAGPLATGWLVLAGCDPASMIGGFGRFSIGLASGSAFAILGGLIFVYRPQNRIGWLCLGAGIGLLYGGAVDFYVPCGLAGTIRAPGLAYAAWFLYSYGIFNLLPMFILLPMVFPTGRFLSPRWRWLTITGIIVAVVGGTAMGLLPDFSQDNGFEYSFPVANPFGLLPLPAWWYPFFRTVGVSFALLILVGIASMIVRFKRSVGDERQQMKWLAYFLVLALGTQMIIFEIPSTFFYPQILQSVWYDLITGVVFVGIPFVIGIAIFKYRLYDIDLIIRRTLAYGLLSAILAITFFGSVVVLQSLFATATGQQSAVVNVISTLLIAALFNPLRLRVQGWIDRRFFRRKYNTERVLAQFAQTARDETDLDALTGELVRVVQETMQPESVSIWLKKTPK